MGDDASGGYKSKIAPTKCGSVVKRPMTIYRVKRIVVCRRIQACGEMKAAAASRSSGKAEMARVRAMGEKKN